MDLVAAPAQFLGCGEAARAGADDADGLREFPARQLRFHPALGEGVVGHETLDGAYGDAFETLFNDAIALAQPVLRADAAADFGEIVRRLADLVRLVQTPLRGELQPIGDIVVERAVHRAERHPALAAAAGLGTRLRHGKVAIDFREILASQGNVALVRLALRQVRESQHSLGQRTLLLALVRRDRDDEAFKLSARRCEPFFADRPALLSR